MRHLVSTIAAVLCFAITSSGYVQRSQPAPQAGEQRIALVIGNSAYLGGSLRNPLNDATDIAATLKGLGFNVLLRTNANRRQMVEAEREFGNQIRRGGVGFFYYAGHGVQSRGRNFLIPICRADSWRTCGGGATIMVDSELQLLQNQSRRRSNRVIGIHGVGNQMG